MFIIPRVAQLRVCRHLIYWCGLDSVCSFQVNRSKSRKTACVDGGEAAVLLKWAFDGIHTQTSYINFQCKNIWFSVMMILCPDRKLLREWQKGKIIFVSVLFEAPGPQQLLLFMILGMSQVQWIYPMLPTSFVCSVNFLHSWPNLSPHSPPIEFKHLPNFKVCVSTQDTCLFTQPFLSVSDILVFNIHISSTLLPHLSSAGITGMWHSHSWFIWCWR